MTDDGEAMIPRKSWLKLALALSLGVNLLIVGAFFGAFLRHEGAGKSHMRGPSLDGFGAPYVRALPKEDRRAILGTLRNDRSGNLPDRKARAEMFQTVVSAVRAVPFDSEGLNAAATRQAETAFGVQRRLQAAWVSRIAAMDDAERAAYADAIEAAMQRRKRKQ